MEENKKPETTNQDKEQKMAPNPLRAGLIRNLLIVFSILVICLIIFWAVNSGARGKQTSYDDLVSKIEAGSVTKIEFDNKYIIAQYADGNLYWIYNSNGASQILLKEFTSGENAAFDMSKITIVLGSGTTFNILNILYPILMIVVLFVLVRMLIKQIGSANNKSMDFVKNRARILPSKVKFSDVAGADEEKAELEEIIEFLKAPDRFTKMGARIPKGVLLVGPPGTGKTLLAKACAGEANVPFFTISGSDFMELFVGVGASRVRDLFETAKKAKPCLIFIDEIDAVGRQRGAGLGGGNDEREQTLNQLLVQMDGFESNEGIIVLAATNRVDILDPALLRPGRFDRRVVINPPDVKGREEILAVHSKNKPIGEDVNLKHIARITSGFTGADIENMLNEAALLAAKEKSTTISMKNMNDALVKVSIGPQKRSHIQTELDKKITAVHESGHAIIGRSVKNGDPVHEVSIIPRGMAGGYTLSRPDSDDRHLLKGKLLDQITMLLGGRTAERLFLDDISTGASNDIMRATEIARSMVTEWGMSDRIGLVSYGETGEVFIGRDYASKNAYSENEASIIDEEIKKIIDACSKNAEKILTENKAKLNTMVDLLLEKETIYQDEVDMIMSGKSKKQILEVINKKLEEQKSKENANSTNTEEVKAEENKKVDIDNLIKIAEEREKAATVAQKNAEKTGENVTEKNSETSNSTQPAQKESKPKTQIREKSTTLEKPKTSKTTNLKSSDSAEKKPTTTAKKTTKNSTTKKTEKTDKTSK